MQKGLISKRISILKVRICQFLEANGNSLCSSYFDGCIVSWPPFDLSLRDQPTSIFMAQWSLSKASACPLKRGIPSKKDDIFIHSILLEYSTSKLTSIESYTFFHNNVSRYRIVSYFDTFDSVCVLSHFIIKSSTMATTNEKLISPKCDLANGQKTSRVSNTNGHQLRKKDTNKE